ncbi:MAG: GxxExxY protein [Anaerolineaceae bacterium]|nr:GxxExxY protein [Anaerolineaceae bacterium]
MDYLYGDTTDRIIGCFYHVANSLGEVRGYTEKGFSKALVQDLRERGFQVDAQVNLPEEYKGRRIGNQYADLIVDNKVLLEVKRAACISQTHINQLKTYLWVSGIPVGLILNFGSEKPTIKRREEKRHYPVWYRQED